MRCGGRAGCVVVHLLLRSNCSATVMGRAGRVLQVSRRCAVKLQAQLRRVILGVRDPCVALRSLVASHIHPQQALSRDSLAALANVSKTVYIYPKTYPQIQVQ